MQDKMRGWLPRTLAALFVSLLAAAGALQGSPAYAGSSSNLAVQDVTVTSPVGLKLKEAPGKAAKSSAHRVPGNSGGVSTQAIASGYHYAGASEGPLGSVQGYYQSNMWVAAPTCSGAGNHSLAEITMQYGNVSGLSRDNIVELGWACEPSAFGDAKPRLFGSCWVNNVWQGSYVGGCGYLDVTTNATNLGADLSGVAGSVKKFAMQYQSSGCGGVGGVNPGIFIWYDTAWVGCFPTIGGANRLSASLTGGDFFQAFGETYKAASPGTCLGMGNDLFPTTSTTATAYFNTLSHVTSGAANGAFNTSIMTDPTVYGALKLSPTTWRYGGKELPTC